MQSSDERSGIEIPEGVKPETIMTSLTLGHGYQWTILTRYPQLIAHGAPTLGSGNMPELLFTSERSLVVSGGDIVYVERIRRVLEMLVRQSHRIRFVKED
jgi:hypothetical protein